jgi:hypothetical protein
MNFSSLLVILFLALWPLSSGAKTFLLSRSLGGETAFEFKIKNNLGLGLSHFGLTKRGNEGATLRYRESRLSILHTDFSEKTSYGVFYALLSESGYDCSLVCEEPNMSGHRWGAFERFNWIWDSGLGLILQLELNNVKKYFSSKSDELQFLNFDIGLKVAYVF